MPPRSRLDQEPSQKQTQNRPKWGAPYLRSVETWSIRCGRRNSVVRVIAFVSGLAGSVHQVCLHNCPPA